MTRRETAKYVASKITKNCNIKKKYWVHMRSFPKWRLFTPTTHPINSQNQPMQALIQHPKNLKKILNKTTYFCPLFANSRWTNLILFKYLFTCYDRDHGKQTKTWPSSEARLRSAFRLANLMLIANGQPFTHIQYLIMICMIRFGIQIIQTRHS